MNELFHYGIRGMKWGVRRTPEELGHKKLIKQARRDAKKYVDAKMYYGEGAGTRRKLLKADRSNLMKNPVYKEAFDKYVSEADYAKSARKARAERKTRDTAKTAKRIFKTALAVSIPVVGLYVSSHSNEIQDFVSKTARNAKEKINSAIMRKEVQDILNRKSSNV